MSTPPRNDRNILSSGIRLPATNRPSNQPASHTHMQPTSHAHGHRVVQGTPSRTRIVENSTKVPVHHHIDGGYGHYFSQGNTNLSTSQTFTPRQSVPARTHHTNVPAKTHHTHAPVTRVIHSSGMTSPMAEPRRTVGGHESHGLDQSTTWSVLNRSQPFVSTDVMSGDFRKVEPTLAQSTTFGHEDFRQVKATPAISERMTHSHFSTASTRYTPSQMGHAKIFGNTTKKISPIGPKVHVHKPTHVTPEFSYNGPTRSKRTESFNLRSPQSMIKTSQGYTVGSSNVFQTSTNKGYEFLPGGKIIKSDRLEESCLLESSLASSILVEDLPLSKHRSEVVVKQGSRGFTPSQKAGVRRMVLPNGESYTLSPTETVAQAMAKYRDLSGSISKSHVQVVSSNVRASIDLDDLKLTKNFSYQTRNSETYEIYSPTTLPENTEKFVREADEKMGAIHEHSREDQVGVFRRNTYDTMSSEVHEVYGDYHRNLVSEENESTQKMVAEAHAKLGPVDADAPAMPWQPKEFSEVLQLGEIPTAIPGGIFSKPSKPKVEAPVTVTENKEQEDAEDVENVEEAEEVEGTEDTEQEGSSLELHYWRVRGKNMYIRAALEYFEIPYKNCPLDLEDWVKDHAPSTEQTHPKLLDKSGEATIEINGFDEVLNYVLTKANKRDWLYKQGCNPDDENENMKYREVRDKILEMQNSMDMAKEESGDVEEFKAKMDLLFDGWKSGTLQELSNELDGESFLFEASKPSYPDFLLWEMVNKLTAMHYDLKLENSVMRFRKLL